jgi:hypothetical protein
MATRKTAKKSVKKAAKMSGSRTVPLYGVPIYGAIRRGNLAEMKKLAAQARKQIGEITSALTALEKKIGKS